jgi:hypothetical protein
MQSTVTQSKSSTSAGGSSLRSPLIVGLGALLAVQLIAALVLGLGGSDLSPADSEGPLLAFEPDQVTRLRIASGEQELVLEKTESGWQLPSLGGFPVSEIRVTDLLGKLAAVERRIPVATSETAMARFRVDDRGFERRLTLEGAEGTLGTLFLGDSPGFRRLFVRAEGDQAVYEAELALFDASDEADDWTKKTVLQLEQEAIEGLTVGELTLRRSEDDAWVLEGMTQEETLDQEAAQDLVRTVANLNFRGVLGTEDKPEYGQGSPLLSLEVDLGEETRQYLLSEMTESEDLVLKVSSQPYFFRLSRFTAEDLTDITREDLIEGGKETVAGAGEAAPAEEPPEATPPSGSAGEPAPAGEAPSADTGQPVSAESETSGVEAPGEAQPELQPEGVTPAATSATEAEAAVEPPTSAIQPQPSADTRPAARASTADEEETGSPAEPPDNPSRGQPGSSEPVTGAPAPETVPAPAR